ncbi:hypothetical protein [Nocardioides coralli]|uniref:hypothetical protein n=1 Tax=Nocardioides coralli TaxID=2872154 RepID=UPI001CA3BA1B|nr:hypothetical protein [Nocardioides coralli]QZY30470.1 hypothetical protein K6T13_07415 [Nocardioides coralli]
MEWLLLLLTGGAGTYAVWRVREVRADRLVHAHKLEQARHIAEEDVTVFGEQLQRLDAEVGDRELGPEAQESYRLALHAYERAAWDASRLRDPDQISALVDTLGSGRYAMACVRAALEGHEPPELRVPCFFNPQHGPSVKDVQWTPPGRGTRMLPACRRCADQVASRERPEIRMVRIGSHRVPYWEAGTVTLPYSYGYFASGQATGPIINWVGETALQGDWEMGHYGDYGNGKGRRR